MLLEIVILGEGKIGAWITAESDRKIFAGKSPSSIILEHIYVYSMIYSRSSAEMSRETADRVNSERV